jgi:hypothetical protein
MAGGRVAVQVQAAGWHEYPVQLYKPVGHHYQIGHDGRLFEKPPHALDHFANIGIALVKYLGVFALCLVAPFPTILERLYLCIGSVALGCFEQYVIPALAIERRVKVDQIHCF